MSIRDIQLPNLDEMNVSLQLAQYLLANHDDAVSSVMRCRKEVMAALQFGCKHLSELRGFTIECYGKDVYANVDILSEACQDMQMLVLLYNASHPDCDFGRMLVAQGDIQQAWELLDFYVDLLNTFKECLYTDEKNRRVVEE